MNKITKKGRKTKTGNCRLVPKREGIRTMSRGDKEGEEEWGAGIGIHMQQITDDMKRGEMF